MKRLWIHEVMRIYHDRMIDQNDSDQFMNDLKYVIHSELKEDINSLMVHLLTENETEVIKVNLILY